MLLTHIIERDAHHYTISSSKKAIITTRANTQLHRCSIPTQNRNGMFTPQKHIYYIQ